ncbi:MAG: aspartyl/asparaginyl beta-hydroxylase [Acidobacteria bacterium]|nr:aspartyl/asparaginyl beta-hydroxylase [Acidobacteriota bacterium]
MDRLTDISLLDGWIPVRFYWREDQPMVDWCYLGRHRLQDPFFEQTVGQRILEPFNLLFRQQTSMQLLGELHEARPGIQPTGFIFHLSRSGSTLVSRMLAALPKNVVISEARPIDATLRSRSQSATVTDEQRSTWLRWMVSALAQRRCGDEEHFFTKFDAWNIFDLPLIRQAFPEVPWIFIYRDPVEVLVSQMEQRGAHMVPGVINPLLFGMDFNAIMEMQPEVYCAKVLAAICQAALQHHSEGGMLVNYTQLPDAVSTSISEFFGARWTEAEKQIMEATTKRNSKDPAAIFTGDSASKQNKAREQLREAARRWLYPIYEELESARAERNVTFQY